MFLRLFCLLFVLFIRLFRMIILLRCPVGFVVRIYLIILIRSSDNMHVNIPNNVSELNFDVLTLLECSDIKKVLFRITIRTSILFPSIVDTKQTKMISISICKFSDNLIETLTLLRTLSAWSAPYLFRRK